MQNITYCFSTATVVTKKRLNVILYVLCLSCYIPILQYKHLTFHTYFQHWKTEYYTKKEAECYNLFSWLAPVSAHMSHLCQWLRVWVQENSCDTMMYCSTRHPLCLLHKLLLIKQGTFWTFWTSLCVPPVINLQYSYFICNISYYIICV